VKAFFEQYAAKEQRLLIGLMSGTSADGIDAALVRISGEGATTTADLTLHYHYPYPDRVRQAVFGLFSPDCPVAEICRMNFFLGELFAKSVLALLGHAGVKPAQVDLVASHGQTVCHLPVPFPQPDGSYGTATLQIGEPAVIAARTGITTIADFRPADMARGGQGAPLVPFADWVLFRHPTRTRAVQNIGGIANVTLLPAGAGLDDIVAFDTGPGNMIIDRLIALLTEQQLRYDPDGRVAGSGEVNARLLAWLMEHAFVRKTPPKTSGREDFGSEFAAQVLDQAREWKIESEDLIATATAFTAESIAANYREFILPRGPVHDLVLGGGGSYNTTLRRMLSERLPGPSYLLHEDLAVLGRAKEAIAFAILANQTAMGLAGNVPHATGALGPAILGKIVPAPPA